MLLDWGVLIRLTIYFRLPFRSAKSGKGSWNWRFKFIMKLPMKMPRLHIQLWDKDLLKWDDNIAEVELDMTQLFKRARHSKVTVSHELCCDALIK